MTKQKIDFNKPLVLHDSRGPTTRKFTIRNKLKNGGFIATADGRMNLDDYLIFDEYGDYVGAIENDSRGSALFFRNKEEAPARFLVEMNAEELAYVRCLLGATYGNQCYALFDDIDDVARLDNDVINVINGIRMNIGPEFERVVAAYEKAGRKVDGQPFIIERKKQYEQD